MKLLVAILLIYQINNIALAENFNLAGLWQTFDDGGKPTGYVRISEDHGVYTGVIEKGLPSDTEEKYCTECKDDRKNQKLIGMTIMKSVRAAGDHFEGPEILEPFSGNTYRVKLTPQESGKKLEVHGYIGLSIFGRTQLWERAE